MGNYNRSFPLVIALPHCPPWGLQGGKAAPGGGGTVIKPSGERTRLYKAKAYPVAPGDLVIMEVGGGIRTAAAGGGAKRSATTCKPATPQVTRPLR